MLTITWGGTSRSLAPLSIRRAANCRAVAMTSSALPPTRVPAHKCGAGLIAMLEGGNHADAQAFLAAEIAALAGEAADGFGGFFADGFYPVMQVRNHGPGVDRSQLFGEQRPGLFPAGDIAKFIAGQPMAKALDNEAFPFPVEISLAIHRQFLFLSNLLGYRIYTVGSIVTA